MPKLIKEYEDMLDSGQYDNEEELCNQEGLNYDDIYEDDESSESD